MRGREPDEMRHATTTIGSGLGAALARQQQALARRWAAARDGHVKAIHRGRVASRRLREVLAVVAAAEPGLRVSRPARTLRRLTRALGPVREIDVAMIELDRAARRHGWSPQLVDVIRRRLGAERDERARRMAGKVGKHDRARLRTELANLAKALPDRDRSAQAALSARIVRRAREVLAAISSAGTIYVPERLHALRIAIKKMRYAIELLPPTPAVDVAGALRLLKRAQRRFGLLHDVQVLAAQVQAIDVAGQRHADRAALESAVDALEADCREIHAQALALVPDIEASARLIRRELGVRRSGRLLRMAKARLEKHTHPSEVKAQG